MNFKKGIHIAGAAFLAFAGFLATPTAQPYIQHDPKLAAAAGVISALAGFVALYVNPKKS